jgi:hypothetical protein
MLSEVALYICLQDGYWRFYQPDVQAFLREVDVPLPPACPQCNQTMHPVAGLERLMLKPQAQQEATN